MREKMKKGFEHWQVVTVYLMIYDAIAINLSYFLALWLRFDCRYTAIPQEYFFSFLKFAPIYTIFSLIIFWLLRMYKSIWRFASYTELLRVTTSTAITAIFHGILISLLYGRMPISYYLIGPVIQFILVLTVRFSYRFILFQRSMLESAKAKSDANIMIIGAGNAGRMIIQDLIRSDRSDGNVVCIIDDNRNKWGRYIEGVPVVGGRDTILSAVEKYKVKKIFFAIPSAPADEKKEILNICHETGCELKSLPGIYQIANGEVNVTDLKDVAIEDLLGREIIKLDLEPVYKMLTGKTVMVTGGGGSIGSELCRQIASHSPKQLIIFDVYENNAYAIQQELISKFPNLNLVVLIGSVRDSGRLQEVFSTYKPQIVYHAAAHKHVPLMEVSPCEAIKNNAIGTYKTAYAAMRNGCERFVLISTDKAVNPTNIMGASKRLCEMIIQTFDYMVKNHRENDIPRLHAHQSDGEWDIPYSDEKIVSHTRFCAVRFGNVLGSNGSVIPLFKQQIAQGGPVKVTHPDIIRYFMLIPEAVSLVLQASVMGKGSEIYVLDMGEPVKIDTLARNLIRLSGKVPDVDIKIEYIGLRPGEKLYEEKLMAEEGLKTTENKKIHIGQPIPFEYEGFFKELKKLMEAAYNEDEAEVYELTKSVVTTFHPTNDKSKKLQTIA